MFYVQRRGHVEGPVSARQLKALARSYEIGLDTLIRRGEQGKWIPASRVQGLFEGIDAASLPRDPAPQASSARREEGPFPEPSIDEFDLTIGEYPDAPSPVYTTRRPRRHSDLDQSSAPSFFGSRTESSGTTPFDDFVQFRRFVTPELLAAAYWILTALLALFIIGSLVYAPIGYYQYEQQPWPHLLNALAGVFAMVGIRVYAEILILFFRIYGVLYEIRTELPGLGRRIDEARS